MLLSSYINDKDLSSINMQLINNIEYDKNILRYGIWENKNDQLVYTNNLNNNELNNIKNNINQVIINNKNYKIYYNIIINKHIIFDINEEINLNNFNELEFIDLVYLNKNQFNKIKLQKFKKKEELIEYINVNINNMPSKMSYYNPTKDDLIKKISELYIFDSNYNDTYTFDTIWSNCIKNNNILNEDSIKKNIEEVLIELGAKTIWLHNKIYWTHLKEIRNLEKELNDMIKLREQNLLPENKSFYIENNTE
jgi:hypothetical protein